MFGRILGYYRRNGMAKTIVRILNELRHMSAVRPILHNGKIQSKDKAYRKWIEDNEPSDAQIEYQKVLASRFQLRPKISIITPVFNPAPEILQETLNSVESQSYDNWELCLADASTDESASEILASFAKRHAGKVKLRSLEKNLGISGNSNAAIEMAEGEFVAFLDHDDLLAPFALYEVVNTLNRVPDAEFIFSDRDIMDSSGMRMHPFFKPGWSPCLFLTQNYLCHLAVIKRELLDRVGWFRQEFDGAQDYDLFLRATEAARRLAHIPAVLYHWRIVQGSSAVDSQAKPYAYESAIQAITEALKRRGLRGTVVHGHSRGYYRVN